MKKICMIAMFKNEAHSIGRMLESVAPYIDYWVIQDNGSTDGTPEIVREWATKHRINGHLYSVEEGWVGFGWNRDHLLQRTKSLDHGCNWILKMDCDEVLEVESSFDWSIFDNTEITSFSIASLAPGIIYQRTWMWNAKLNWRFHHDPAHETIYLDDGVTNENFGMHALPKTFRMKADDTVRGESYICPTKYVSDALVLEEKMLREQTILQDWYHFWYIGKSYEDAFKCQVFPFGTRQQRHYAERSIYYYKEWINHHHNYDATGIPSRICEMGYYAMNSIGTSYRFLGEIEKAIEYFKKSEPFCPRRNDHLIWLAESYMNLGDFDEMLKYTTEVMKPERTMPFPDFVFIICTDMYHDTSEYPKNLHNIALQNIVKKEESIVDNKLSINPIKKKRIFVVDDFYADPYAVRNFALSTEFKSDNDWYKGNRSTQKFLTKEIKESFENIMGIKIREWESHGMNGSFQYCTPQDLLVYHYDSQTWAGMIYLTPDAPYDCGTSLFASKTTKARHLDDDLANISFAGGFYDSTKFDLVDNIGNVFNRLVLFDARCFHSASKYFGTDINDSRLFHLFFFD